jgi:hypothetical protein
VYLELLSDGQARSAVCAGLGEMKSAAARAVPALVELLGASLSSDIQIMKALGEIGPAAGSALPALDSLAGDPRFYIATPAKKAASRIRGEPQGKY